MNYEKVPNFNPKDKTTLTSGDVVAYFKSLIIESEFFTFDGFAARQMRLQQRIHRYLMANLSSYVSKCNI